MELEEEDPVRAIRSRFGRTIPFYLVFGPILEMGDGCDLIAVAFLFITSQQVGYCLG